MGNVEKIRNRIMRDGVLCSEQGAYSLMAVLQELISYGKLNAVQKKLEFRFCFSEELPRELIGDSAQLIQICTKLLSNAIKYTNSGYVSLYADWKETGPEEGVLGIRIKDTGIGIKPEDIGKAGSDYTGTDGSNLSIESICGEGTEILYEIKQKVNTSAKPADTAENVMLNLDELDFLHVNAGMACCCNSEKNYKEKLLAFCEKEKLEDIEAFYEIKDWDNYGILLHVLKSTALAIGAEELSEMAKQLGTAAREENHYYIDSHHTETMKEYRRVLEGIEKIFTVEQPEQDKKTVLEKGGSVLVVDDDAMNLKIAESILAEHFDVRCASSGKDAFALLDKEVPELILLDLHMPEMNGFEIMKQLKENRKTKQISVILLTSDNDREAEIRGFKEGAQDFITKPFIAEIMLQRVGRILELTRLQNNLQKEVKKQTRRAEERRKQVERLSDQIISALAETIDAKDAYTNGHSLRVARYSVEIAKRLGKNEEEQERIRYMAMLHDIGKIGIPDSIITKNSSLSDKEYFVTRKHPEIGAEILANISEIPDLATGARWHHERYDGTGYPDGLKGKEIPEEARIIAVADAYDAMASKRSYRDVLDQQEIYDEIKKGIGTQFDPVFAEIMLQMIGEDTDYQMREK